jgi:hypothetical protein
MRIAVRVLVSITFDYRQSVREVAFQVKTKLILTVNLRHEARNEKARPAILAFGPI